jgi:hypothetical protein
MCFDLYPVSRIDLMLLDVLEILLHPCRRNARHVLVPLATDEERRLLNEPSVGVNINLILLVELGGAIVVEYANKQIFLRCQFVDEQVFHSGR